MRAEAPNLPAVLVLLGPTATGKTAVGIEVALRVGGEIISADSRALFAGLHIVTGKPTLEERRGIPHHLIDSVPIDRGYDAMAFRRDVNRLTSAIRGRGCVPLIVGGSTLYLGAVLRGMFVGASKDSELRQELDQRPREELHRRLRSVDPKAAEAIHPSDRLRIVRALEVYELTGTPISQWQAQSEPLPYRFVVLGLRRDRDDHRAAIVDRVRRMLAAGLVDEISFLREDGLAPGQQAFRTIGVPEVFAFLDGRWTEHELEEGIVRATWALARRQIAWFRREQGVTWIDVTGRTTEHVAEEVVNRWENAG